MSELVNETMNRVEGRLKTLSESLSRLEGRADVLPVAKESAVADFDDAISDDLSEVNASLQKLRGARQDMYRYAFAQSQQKTFGNLDEIKRLADVMTGLEQKVNELLNQCDKLEATRQNLEKFSSDATLNDLLRKSTENLTRLDSCDEKIRETSDAAAANFENIKTTLDKRISDALTLEREFLITCREVSTTTKNLTDAVHGIDARQKSDITLAVDSLCEKLSDRLQKIEESISKASAPPESPTAVMLPAKESSNEIFFEDICRKIYERISNDENAKMYNAIRESKLNANDAKELNSWNPSIHKKVVTYVRSMHHFLKVYTDIDKILREAER